MNRRALLFSLAFGSLMAADAATAAGIDGTWILVEVGGKRVKASTGFPPYFKVSGRNISGFDGCNRFFGKLDKAASVVSTRMGCFGGGVARLPLDLGNPGAHLKRAKLSGKTLYLPARGGHPSSAFRRG